MSKTNANKQANIGCPEIRKEVKMVNNNAMYFADGKTVPEVMVEDEVIKFLGNESLDAPKMKI